VHIPYARDNLRADYIISAQNVARETGYGAFTGEITSDMLLDSGIYWAIVGHSERRAGFGGPGESSQLVAEKTKNGIDKGMSIIACVGELLSEREAGKTLEVILEQQLVPIARALTLADWAKVVIAYEPVWAIGTGVTATPEQAEEVHAAIRKWMAANINTDIARATRIIYGGSVKGSNAAELIAKPNIDGFLVGGASLKPDFLTIIDACRN
jgi:triosephosphate isomerase